MSNESRRSDPIDPIEIICFVAINTHGGHMCTVKTDGISRPDFFRLDSQTELHIFTNASIGNVNFAFTGENYRESLIPLNNHIGSQGEISLEGMLNLLLRRKAIIKQDISMKSPIPIGEWDKHTREFMNDDYIYIQHVAPLNTVSNKSYSYNSVNEGESAIYLLTAFKAQHDDEYTMIGNIEDITSELQFTEDNNTDKSITLSRIIDKIKGKYRIRTRDKLTIIIIDDSCDTLSSTRPSESINDRNIRSVRRDVNKVPMSYKLKPRNKHPIEKVLNNLNSTKKKVKIMGEKTSRDKTSSLGGAKKHKRKTQKNVGNVSRICANYCNAIRRKRKTVSGNRIICI
jgi:hypothetical protein